MFSNPSNGADQLPVVIQGGMGVAISNWRLAKAVSRMGQMGVVSGTGISRIFVSRLADGDLSGDVRRALSHFPIQDPIQKILDRYYIPGGKDPSAPYKSPQANTVQPPQFVDQLTVIATFVEVFLAKEGHSGLIGINLLEKIQMANLAGLYGAVLGGVDFVLMGAGIPTQVAGTLDKLALHKPVKYRLDVLGAAPTDDFHIELNPEAVFPGITEKLGPLPRPRFLPIISSVVLAQALIKRSEGPVNGFIIEGPTAGGHNAPPRGAIKLNDKGEPIYGEKDVVDLEKIRQLGLPFWLAGGYARPEQVKAALASGAAGVQIGTAFALCNESGMETSLKQRILAKVLEGDVSVLTSLKASPTGFPFKVASLEGTLSEAEVYEARPRICDLGYLRVPAKQPNGAIRYRCAAEPVKDYVAKGGDIADTVGRSCLCNSLVASAGFPQRRKDGYVEMPMVTAGDDLAMVRRFISPEGPSYSARDVLNYLLETNFAPEPEAEIVQAP